MSVFFAWRVAAFNLSVVVVCPGGLKQDETGDNLPLIVLLSLVLTIIDEYVGFVSCYQSEIRLNS
jgi:hypothetical protein